MRIILACFCLMLLAEYLCKGCGAASRHVCTYTTCLFRGVAGLGWGSLHGNVDDVPGLAESWLGSHTRPGLH
ncbi:hypothetical protein F4824DRAFT_471141 [Ustulina deusta]|nr:hypothetical protein F4824DRAFT_471141 [Ustulina deusta]